jgi:hypothetical protein
MFSVIKLGGCNGSGKTTVARALLAEIKGVPRCSRKTKKNPDYYIGEWAGTEVLVLGPYVATCGGMDSISDKLQRMALIQWACKGDRIVFFEGLITGKTYGAIGAVSELHLSAQRGKWLYAFMDTPFETCVARVGVRRAAAGKGMEDFDPERTMRPTFDSCTSLLRKIQGVQKAKIGEQPFPHPTHLVKHDKSPKAEAIRLLKEAEKLRSA